VPNVDVWEIMLARIARVLDRRLWGGALGASAYRRVVWTIERVEIVD